MGCRREVGVRISADVRTAGIVGVRFDEDTVRG
jgi:hypothetical protein